MFAYCFNNPVNMDDPTGNWPKWAKKLVAAAVVVVAVAAVAAVTVATAGAGTAAYCIAMGAAQGAAMGALSGAVSGAVTGAVTHRITTGSWEGAGQAALEGAADVALEGAITGAINGGINSPYCFIAGTAVLAVAGHVAIEQIKAGDYVWAWDEATGDVALKKVVETYVNETDELVHVFVNGEEIVTTPSHPFYSPVKGWTDAVHLRAGDILVLVNGEYVVVEKVQHEVLEAPIAVYNFQVEDYHTYYVSGSDVLVHNMCAQPNDSMVKLTNNKEARRVAKQLGYRQTAERSHGQIVFENKKASSPLRYITRDIDSHNGGVWKAADSVKNLGSQTTRSGTYTRYLMWIGD